MLRLPPAAKRLVSIAFFAALVFLGARTCQTESVESELVFKVRGEVAETVRELEVRLFERGESELVGQFRKYYQAGVQGPEGRWPLKLAEGDYRLEGDLHTDTRTIPFERDVELEDGESLSIYLEGYLTE